jgi:hypothetical protein
MCIHLQCNGITIAGVYSFDEALLNAVLSYLEDLKLAIDNYVLDYFVIGVIMIVLLYHSFTYPQDSV